MLGKRQALLVGGKRRKGKEPNRGKHSSLEKQIFSTEVQGELFEELAILGYYYSPYIGGSFNPGAS